jgi:hypothetical protein
VFDRTGLIISLNMEHSISFYVTLHTQHNNSMYSLCVCVCVGVYVFVFFPIRFLVSGIRGCDWVEK